MEILNKLIESLLGDGSPKDIWFYIAQAVGLAAVTFYLLGYLQKKRGTILTFNLTARVLYVLQYVLLGAFEGAVLDVSGSVASVLAGKKEQPFIKRYRIAFIIGVNLLIVAMGLLVYESPLSLLPIGAVMLHTGAFWLSDEKWVRRISLLGCPLWFIYNFKSEAYFSSLGDFLSFLFILISIFRYDVPRKTPKKQGAKETLPMTLSPLFTSHMVLAMDKPIRVFGTGEGKATVRFLDHVAEAECKDGKWLATLPPVAAGGPYDMTVELAGETVTLTDVDVGRVILYCGQSNMVVPLKESATPEERRTPPSSLRLFYAAPSQHPGVAYTHWRVADRESIEEFSTVGGLSGAALARETGVAVGAVLCAQGASMIEAWLPEGTMDALDIHLTTEQKSRNFTVPPYCTWNGDGYLYHLDFLPLCPFVFSAAVWYQGESNGASVAASEAYEAQLTELIRRWRADLKDESLPFVIVQLADYEKCECPAGWRKVQETQLAIVQKIENTSAVVCRDVCESTDIHPKTKHLLADRVTEALKAL